MSGQIKLIAASLGGDVTLAPQDTATSVVVTVPAVTATLLNNQSDIEVQSKTALNASGSAPIYACRAWVNFNGTGTVAIRASGNVSSITDNGTGDYTVNFATAMPDANYGVAFGGYEYTSSGVLSQTTSAMRFNTLAPNNGVYVDRTIVQVAIFR